MAPETPTPVIINGHLWIDVTDITTGGPVYSYQDVVDAGGQIPTSVSDSSSD